MINTHRDNFVLTNPAAYMGTITGCFLLPVKSYTCVREKEHVFREWSVIQWNTFQNTLAMNALLHMLWMINWRNCQIAHIRLYFLSPRPIPSFYS